MSVEETAEVIPGVLYLSEERFIGSAATRHPMGVVAIDAVSYAG